MPLTHKDFENPGKSDIDYLNIPHILIQCIWENCFINCVLPYVLDWYYKLLKISKLLVHWNISRLQQFWNEYFIGVILPAFRLEIFKPATSFEDSSSSNFITLIKHWFLLFPFIMLDTETITWGWYLYSLPSIYKRGWKTKRIVGLHVLK